MGIGKPGFGTGIGQPGFGTPAPVPTEGDSGPLSITNSDKLSLSLDTAVGTQVAVSDGFYVTGFGDARDGFYINHPEALAGTLYVKFSDALITYDGDTIVHFDASGAFGNWRIGSGNTSYTESNSVTVNASPWQDDWTAICTLTHPALQTLAAPDNTTKAAMFIDAIGVCTKLDTQSGGKDQFALLGGTDPTATGGVLWDTDRFKVYIADGTYTYYSTSAVATPDLASGWKLASDDSDASITVTAMTAGELAAGLRLPDADPVRTLQVNGNENGRLKYTDVTGGPHLVRWDGSDWLDEGDIAINTANVSTPDKGTSSYLRDDIAAEENWQAIPADLAKLTDPSIASSDLVEGTTTTVTPGTYDGDTMDLTYQWFRADDAEGTGASDIGGETGSTYDFAAADVDKYVGVRETATETSGDEETMDTDSNLLGPIEASTPAGESFSDDFDRADSGDLGANWDSDVVGGAGIANFKLAMEFPGTKNLCVYTGTACATEDQYCRVRFTDSVITLNYLGIILRYTDSVSPHYGILFAAGEQSVTWVTHADASANNVDIASTAFSFSEDDYVGVTVIGSDDSTVVRIWLNPVGVAPDAGGTTWNGASPGVTFTTNPSSPINSGSFIGLYCYPFGAGLPYMDDFSGGDVP